MLSSPALDVRNRTEGSAVSVAFVIEAVLIIGGNVLIIAFFALEKKERKKSFYLVFSMAFADVLLGAVSLPLFTYLSIGPDYQLWRSNTHRDVFKSFWSVSDTILMHSSLIFAVCISCERFYAIFWPLKHRTLSRRTYRIFAIMIWASVILVSCAMFAMIKFAQLSLKNAYPLAMTFELICLLIVCACNIGIFKKFKQGKIASQRQNSQNRVNLNKRLTKTLLLVSVLAVLTYLPLIIVNFLIFVLEVSIPRKYFYYKIVVFLNYSNSFVNPLVYALRIPAFKQWLRSICCSSRQALAYNNGGQGHGDNRGAIWMPPIDSAKKVPNMHSRYKPSEAGGQTE